MPYIRNAKFIRDLNKHQAILISTHQGLEIKLQDAPIDQKAPEYEAFVTQQIEVLSSSEVHVEIFPTEPEAKAFATGIERKNDEYLTCEQPIKVINPKGGDAYGVLVLVHEGDDTSDVIVHK